MSSGFPVVDKIIETGQYSTCVPICYIYDLMKSEQRHWLTTNISNQNGEWSICSLGRQKSLELGYGAEMKCIMFKNPMDATAFKLRFNIPGVP